MKKFLSTIILTFLLCQVFSQEFMNHALQEKIKNGTATLYDYRDAFNEYWAPYHVDGSGYYMDHGVRTKAYGWKQFKRWEWEMMRQVDTRTGAFPSTNLYLEIKKYGSEHPSSRNLYGNWTEIGSIYSWSTEGTAGRINCIAFHPTDQNTFWVGAPTGGLWKTTNFGATWTCLTDDLAYIGISDILIMPDYVTSHTILIATGDRDDIVGVGAGIFKSTDGGSTWQETGLMCTNLDDFCVNRLLLDTDNVDIMFAATSNGIYKTNNGGTTWSLKKSGWFTDMEFLPGSTEIIYSGRRISSDSARIYLSTDGGNIWQQVLARPGKRAELAVSAALPGRMYAVLSNGTGGLYGVYRFEDTCSAFYQVLDGSISGNNILSTQCSASGTNGQGSYDLAIQVNPEDADEVYIGGIHTWRSTNAGSTWQILNNGYQNCGYSIPDMHVDKHALEFQPGTGNLFEGNDGGICYSPDYGLNWTDLSVGLNINQHYRIGVAQTVADQVLGGIQDNGTFLWDGDVFINVGGSDGQNCIIDPLDEDIQYVSNQMSAIKRTLNHWSTSTLISNNIYPADSGGWTTPYLLDPTDPQILFVGYHNLWKSTDRGDSFTMIYDVPNNLPLLAMAIAPNDPDYICISNLISIYLTTNGGVSFNEIKNNLPLGFGCFIQSIAFDFNSTSKIWVALSSFANGGIWETSDFGATWHNISGGLPAVPVNVVVQNQLVSSYDELYAGTLAGVYVKSAGQPWTAFNAGLPMVQVNDLEFYYNGASSKLRAGTWGRGLWESDPFSYETSMPAIWTGIQSTNWFDTENWQFRKVPASDEDVTIPAGRPHYPIISSASAACYELIG